MMRTKNEIRQAVAILRHKGDRISMLQAATLEEGRNEAWVFATYVTSVPEDAKDEAAFFAARDAARFAAGHIGLEELVPDVQSMTAADFAAAGALGVVDEKSDTLLLSRSDYDSLIARIEQLEKQMYILYKKHGKEVVYHQVPTHGKDDFMIQEEAFKYIGCSKATIHSWTKKGLIKGYRKGAHVYYSQSELDANPTVRNFRNLK